MLTRLTCLAVAFGLAVVARADEPVVAVLADFEDNTIGVGITDVANVLAADCSARFEANPARGQRSLAVTIGATAPKAAATCELRFQFAIPFSKADKIATQAWIDRGEAEVAFRLRDAKGRTFETAAVDISSTRRWTRLTCDLSADKLRRIILPAVGKAAGSKAEIDDASPVEWPIEITGYRVTTDAAARQVVFLDDLQVEHVAPPHEMIRGRFILDRQTHVYEPGAQVVAQLLIENFSRKQQLQLSVQASWLRADGSELKSAQGGLNLPASGADFRSRQSFDFSQRVEEPGLYRLVARAKHSTWRTPVVLETTVAVTAGNRTLPRGRATFFAVRTNLLREPLDDQTAEIELARDIGVQLVAVDAPWRSLEPKRGAFDLSTLEPIVTAISKRDMDCMIILGEPPEWLPAADLKLSVQAGVIEAMARAFGPKVRYFQPMAAAPLTGADVTALKQLQTQVSAIQNTASIIPPPISLDDPAAGPPIAELSDSGLPIGFEATAGAGSPVSRFLAYASRTGRAWRRDDWWWQRDEPRPDTGFLFDAVAVLREYVEAARLGISSVVWFDLRDDTVDSRYPEQMRGLARRDYSPKTVLLGYANAVGMLSGLAYRGPLAGTPDEFESALFMSSDRQVAVLLPKRNRSLPMFVAPQLSAAGELAAFDFERRRQPKDAAWAAGLIRTLPRPMFLSLAPEKVQTDPQISLGTPWLRLPAHVFIGSEGSFTVELDNHPELGLRFVDLEVPARSGLKTTFTPTEIKSEKGKPVRLDIKLTRSAGSTATAPALITLRVATATQNLELPIEVRPLFTIRPVADAAKLTPADHELSRLRTPGGDDRGAGLPILAAYDAGKIVIAIPPAAEIRAGSQLLIGIAAEGAAEHAIARISAMQGEPKIEPAFGASGHVAKWSVSRGAAAAGGLLTVQIPFSALGIDKPAAGQKLLLAARLSSEGDGRAGPRPALAFGTGLDGDRSTLGYEWVELGK